MGKYVENNLGKNENIVKKAELNWVSLIPTWFGGLLFSFLLLIPLIKAIIATVKFFNVELAITNKRVIGKTGVVNTSALDAPLNKIQNVSVRDSLWGKILNYGTVQIDTAAGKYTFNMVKNANAFKGMVMAQIDQYEEDRIKQQAAEMANAMSAALKSDKE